MDVYEFRRFFLGLGNDNRNVFDRNLNNCRPCATYFVAHQTNQKIRYNMKSNLKFLRRK